MTSLQGRHSPGTGYYHLPEAFYGMKIGQLLAELWAKTSIKIQGSLVFGRATWFPTQVALWATMYQQIKPSLQHCKNTKIVLGRVLENKEVTLLENLR